MTEAAFLRQGSEDLMRLTLRKLLVRLKMIPLEIFCRRLHGSACTPPPTFHDLLLFVAVRGNSLLPLSQDGDILVRRDRNHHLVARSLEARGLYLFHHR